MLTGEYRNTIDEKGRVLIPSRLRAALEDNTSLIITRSVENCLWIMTPTYFEFVRKNIMDGNGAMFNSDTRLLQRFIIGQAMECDLDKAGRLLIPPQLRAKINLNVKEESVLLAVSTYMELWNVPAYEEFCSLSEPLFKPASQNLSVLLNKGGNIS